MTYLKNLFSVEAGKDKAKMKRNTTHHSCDCSAKPYWLSRNESRGNRRPEGAREVSWLLLQGCPIAKGDYILYSLALKLILNYLR